MKSLDLFSTSQTKPSGLACAANDSEPEKNLTCEYGAPLLAYQKEGQAWGVVQAVCNHWNCSRCGPMIAKKHYGRIVEGCRELHKAHGNLYFLTITCRGLGLTKTEAEAGYLKWTNRLMTALRTDARRKSKPWAYVAVTERQRRGHPHSHIITPYYPDDLAGEQRYRYKTDNAGKRRREYYQAQRSAWIETRVRSAGLGREYDISVVDNVEAVSRYVAKYLFKETLQTEWPKGWRRVRYSRGWWNYPKSESEALALLTTEDFELLAMLAKTVHATTLDDKRLDWLNREMFGRGVAVYVGDCPVLTGMNKSKVSKLEW